MRNELESRLQINTTVLGDEPGMSKEVKILKNVEGGEDTEQKALLSRWDRDIR